jgi:aspartyl-tRNA(Asn)/glutamyl-tRNA(Gln) amidotransferase subunit C
MTTTITPQDVDKIARLANLPLAAGDKQQLGDQLLVSLEYVAKLQQLDTSAIAPTSQITGLENVFREDEVTASLPQEEALKNAKRVWQGYFVVDAIFE